jgi:purine-cytosine permease-like protein
MESYFFRRLLSMNRVPDNRASPLTAELASISGTGAALAVATVPTSINMIPTIFIPICLLRSIKNENYFFRRLLSNHRPLESSAKAPAPELASISGTAVALAVTTMPANTNTIPTIFILIPFAKFGSVCPPPQY